MLCNEAVSTGHDSSHGFTRFGMLLQRAILHGLLKLETPRRFTGMLGDRFVDISGHRNQDVRQRFRPSSAVNPG